MRNTPPIALALILAACMAVGTARPADADDGVTPDAATRAEISQYGVTWTFAEPARTGRYVTGDWWVVGPVTVEGISPAPAEGRNGSAVNPPAGGKQGYDDRMHGYDASLRAEFPLKLEPGQSLVSTDSVETIGEKTPQTVPGQYCRGPLRTAVVLTCVAKPPADDAFRPAYVGTWKERFRASQLRTHLLPELEAPSELPPVARYERFLQRIWLDHQREWPNRKMHPLENMPDYGREITNIVQIVAMMLVVADPDGEREGLLRDFVQLGIDYYGVTQSHDDLWTANGGHNSGRKLPILFAGLLLGHEGMMNVEATFAEDQQTYYGEGWHGQKALWKISGSEARKHEDLPPAEWDGERFKGANNGWKSEGYRSLNGPTWTGEALVARLLGLKDNWDHPAFFDYVDRWVREADDGRVNKKVLVEQGRVERVGYDPFYSEFARAMWTTYRDRADEIGAEVEAKAENGAESK